VRANQKAAPISQSEPGNREIVMGVPDALMQRYACSVQPFLIDLAAAPVPPVTTPFSSYSRSGDGQASGLTTVSVTLPKVVVPVPFHLIVPVVAPSVPVVDPLPPVFFVSVHPESLILAERVVLFTVPFTFEHDNEVEAAFVVAAFAVPANASDPAKGNATRLPANNHRRI
jgi:hypothetical protein